MWRPKTITFQLFQFLVIDPLAISGTVGTICDVGWDQLDVFVVVFFYNNSL